MSSDASHDRRGAVAELLDKAGPLLVTGDADERLPTARGPEYVINGPSGLLIDVTIFTGRQPTAAGTVR
jgi:hypothetical protein